MVTYTAIAQDDRERMDLYCFDVDHNAGTRPVSRLLINANDITITSSDISKLSAAERADRERRRQFSHGITQYDWHPDGRRLLIPMDGQAYLCDSQMAQQKRD